MKGYKLHRIINHLSYKTLFRTMSRMKKETKHFETTKAVTFLYRLSSRKRQLESA